MSPFSARSLALLAAAVLIPRVALGLLLGVVGNPEIWEYDVIAASISRGDGHLFDRNGFVYAAYSPPLWSYLLAAALGLFDHARVVIQVLQALLCLAASVIFAAVAQRLSGDRGTGLLTGFLVATQPSLLYYSVAKSDSLPLNIVLLGLILATGIALTSSPRYDVAAAFGGLVGLSVLSRGTPIVALPLVAAVLLARRKGQALRPLAVALAALGVTLAPWLIRNVAVLGTPLITSTASENLWRGNHLGAGGGVADLGGGRITWLDPKNPALSPTIRAVLEKGTEVQRYEVFQAEAWQFIREEPLAALELFATKARILWWRIDSDPRDYSLTFSIAYEVLYRLELGLALVGAVALLRSRGGVSGRADRPAAGLALALMIGISLLQCAFYVQGRHRFFIEPVLLMFTATGVMYLVARLRAVRERSTADP